MGLETSRPARIDHWLGEYHYRERHSIEIRAGRGDAYRALTAIDLGDSLLIRCLLQLRGLGGLVQRADSGRLSLPMQTFLERGFTRLVDAPPEELLVGAVGRFWRPAGGRVEVPAERFRASADPGVAKLVMMFRTEPAPAGRTCLITETRVWCSDRWARRRFRCYWYLIRPASGLIRREMLRLAKCRAEAAAQA